MDKLSWLSVGLVTVLAGCSGSDQRDAYLDASFELCNTDVKVYSTSDDERVRIVCADGSKFALDNKDTLAVMRDINLDYCDGEGLSKFNETSRYYSFQCKSGSLLSITK
ncbi:hypothetical protein NTE19_003336 [Vibrio fluvialis]|nr:hypothetical protein [Vibrio fluvialis]